eukprot:TRINITY_DN26643_c0_g2_i2.p1 TRINITY_DN26643_c0_g2~~TRINITY_DN26643_c0_g2_i2.p1  ORF type:complete len:306 (-),score=21.66 TRINITY_DN26643_c0_g2_i2:54-971(-)
MWPRCSTFPLPMCCCIDILSASSNPQFTATANMDARSWLQRRAVDLAVNTRFSEETDVWVVRLVPAAPSPSARASQPLPHLHSSTRPAAAGLHIEIPETPRRFREAVEPFYLTTYMADQTPRFSMIPREGEQLTFELNMARTVARELCRCNFQSYRTSGRPQPVQLSRDQLYLELEGMYLDGERSVNGADHRPVFKVIEDYGVPHYRSMITLANDDEVLYSINLYSRGSAYVGNIGTGVDRGHVIYSIRRSFLTAGDYNFLDNDGNTVAVLLRSANPLVGLLRLYANADVALLAIAAMKLRTQAS